jgi:hypothetical protein
MCSLREGYGIAAGVDGNGTTELLRIDPEMLRRPAVKILAFECRRLRMSCTIWPGYSKTSRSGSRPLCPPPGVPLYLSVFTAHYTFGRGANPGIFAAALSRYGLRANPPRSALGASQTVVTYRARFGIPGVSRCP